ncbi:hypothetical protein [Paenibacillus hamazuiensis]|uniref:hypothetical protein n=1 Tax=Paenibacillus hamazuiensis TaxID=2936508 RepID=UPI00200E0475|nr:hypothetical protein [Paenibacillus hamazuiensis]
MQELVGYCAQCGTEVYCRGGFLEGSMGKDGKLICIACGNQEDQEHDERQSGQSSHEKDRS